MPAQILSRPARSRPAPLAMPWRGKDVPHAVIEVNQKCNISCTACYKDKSSYTKPVAQIAAELELAARSRRLAVVTLAGGEPTLHPELPSIISLVAERGIVPQMLSNGLTLTDERLAAYREAGLRRIYLHVDSLQRRPDAKGAVREQDLHALRTELGTRVARSGIRAALSLTLYRTKNLADLSSVVSFVLGNPLFDRFLVTCYTDVDSIGARLRARGLPVTTWQHAVDTRGEEVPAREVGERLADELGLAPYAYVPSDRSESEMRWLLYYAFSIHRPDGSTVTLPVGRGFQRVLRVANAVSHALRGTYPFEQKVSRSGGIALCLLQAACDSDPGTLRAAKRFLEHLREPGAELVQKSLIFQQGPNVTEGGDLEICRDCPDATVRNGRLVPLCLADVLGGANPTR